MQYPNIKTKYTKADPDKLSQILAKSTKVSIAIDHLNLGYAFCEYDTVLKMDTLEKFTVLKEDMSFAYGVFAFYKNSVILPLLDHFILNLQEYGLDNFIMAEVSVYFLFIYVYVIFVMLTYNVLNSLSGN